MNKPYCPRSRGTYEQLENQIYTEPFKDAPSHMCSHYDILLWIQKRMMNNCEKSVWGQPTPFWFFSLFFKRNRLMLLVHLLTFPQREWTETTFWRSIWLSPVAPPPKSPYKQIWIYGCFAGVGLFKKKKSAFPPSLVSCYFNAVPTRSCTHPSKSSWVALLNGHVFWSSERQNSKASEMIILLPREQGCVWYIPLDAEL